MTKDYRFKGEINPLAFLEVDEPWEKHSQPPEYDDIVKFLCTQEINSDKDSIIQRYRDISQEPKRLIIAPAEKNILSKIVWPLKQAKGSHMVGNYLGTVALCGMVAEMIAILIWEMSDFSIRDKPLDTKTENELFGKTFERLGQHRRIEVLKGFDLIGEDIKKNFDLIREKRRRYLHLYSEEHTNVEKDSIKIFHATVSIVVEVFGQGLEQGKIILKPLLVKYLDKMGLLES